MILSKELSVLNGNKITLPSLITLIYYTIFSLKYYPVLNNYLTSHTIKFVLLGSSYMNVLGFSHHTKLLASHSATAAISCAITG